MTRARKPTRDRNTTLVIELESNRARFGNRTRIKSSSRPTELNNICSRATELDIDFSGRGRGEGGGGSADHARYRTIKGKR